MSYQLTSVLQSLQGLRIPILVLFVLSILVELLWARRHNRQIHNAKETTANLFILAVGQLVRMMLLGYQMFWLALGASLAPWSLPSTLLAFGLTFVVVDFAYYWEHRALHRVPLLWALHEVHHSSPWFNLTASFRLNWLTPLILGPFHMVLTIIGLPPDYVIGALALNLVFQFFLHSEAIGRVPYLEGILNTPSAHRVHHGVNSQYIDKNFAGVLVVWDRLFGTYEAEVEPVRFGVPQGFVGHNPFTAMVHGLVIWRRVRLPELRRRLRRLA